jgi:anti-sigma factor RsiW
MSNCKKLEPLVTPYVDGELDDSNRGEVDAHLSVCPPCHSRVAAERAIRDLLRTRRPELARICAPEALRSRCASTWSNAGAGSPTRSRSVGRWLVPVRSFAVAAALVLVVGGASLYEITDRSTRVMAAELVADHVKCFGVVNHILRTDDEPSAVEASLETNIGWRLRLPVRPEQVGLALVGARLCLYGKGRVAHIMYTHNGHPVSVFMLPKCTRPEQIVGVLGHQAAIWSAGDRTFVLIAREPPSEVQRMASFVQAALR